MNVVVTGANGFVGQAACLALSRAGHAVTAYARSSSSGSSALVARWVTGDSNDPNALVSACAHADVLVHCAGVSDLRANADTCGWSNVAATENMMRVVRHTRLPRVVAVSCLDVQLVPASRSFWDVNHSLTHAPMGELARSKLLAEELIQGSVPSSSQAIILRPAVVWGPSNNTHMRQWQQEAATGGLRVLGGGQTLYATTHIDNLAASIVAAVQAPKLGSATSIYAIVDNELRLACDFFSDVADALGSQVRPLRWPLVLSRLAARVGAGVLTEEEVVRRSFTSAASSQPAINEIGYAPVTTHPEAFAELKHWCLSAGRRSAASS